MGNSIIKELVTEEEVMSAYPVRRNYEARESTNIKYS